MLFIFGNMYLPLIYVSKVAQVWPWPGRGGGVRHPSVPRRPDPIGNQRAPPLQYAVWRVRIFVFI